MFSKSDIVQRVARLWPSDPEPHDSRVDHDEKQHPLGFSLVELMVVLVIIGLLAGLVTINVRGALIRANQNAARAEISTIANALEAFQMLQQRYPTNEEGLEILTTVSDSSGEKILNFLPSDPWGRPYQYNRPGRDSPYEVFSLGADGREGGEGADADVGSWNLQERGSER